MTQGNAAPEDIERVLELSADDLVGVGYDISTGFGRINANNALELIKLPQRQLLHVPSNNTSSTRSSTLVASGVEALTYSEALPGIDGYMVEANVYEVEITYNHSGELTGSATFVNGWNRNSACTGINVIDAPMVSYADYNNFGCEKVGNIDGTNAVFKTFVYEVINYKNASGWHNVSTPIWFPSTISNAECTYTLLIEDLTATDIEKTPEDEISVRLMPNPSNDKAFLRYVLLEDANTLRIDLHDINGKIIRNIYNGEQSKGVYSRELNVTDLASGLYFVHLYNEQFSITKKLNEQYFNAFFVCYDIFTVFEGKKIRRM